MLIYRYKKNNNILKQFLLFVLFSSAALWVKVAIAQDSRPGIAIDRLNDKMLTVTQDKYSTIEKGVKGYSEKSLKRLQKKEAVLIKILQQKDSSAARKLYEQGREKYTHLLQKLRSTTEGDAGSLHKEYLPRLDSLATSLKFIQQAGQGTAGLSLEKLKQIQAVSGQLQSLQSTLQSSADIQQFIKKRQQLFKEQLEKHGMLKELKGFHKETYYYQQKMAEYKAAIADPKKREEKMLSIVKAQPGFKDFMTKNSQLSQLFNMPGTGNAQQIPAGLQSRASIQDLLTDRLGTGTGAGQSIQQGMQQAQAELNKLKDKIKQAGGSSSDLIIPDFKPNQQKTKSFWKRIEYSLNIQSQKSNSLLPVTSDIAITMGYKINDKSTVGIGAGYKLGFGNSFKDIHLTSQGMSLRSFIDMKLKGSIWISGGYEENYMQGFSSVEQLKNLNAWQQSGLIGLTKKYKIGSKNGNLQLLWDFLSNNQVSKSAAFKFRLGYTF
jgi:predicted nucleic acid-binding Zn ribbon protein